ncbi:MAG: translocation and assembly module TamA, partial [Bacteroidia bacterium]
LEKGKTYNFITIQNHNLTPGYLASGSSTLSLFSFIKLQKTILSSYEESGYPFAKIVLTNTQIEGDTLVSSLQFDPYLKFVYDTIVHLGNCQISSKYLSKYLDIQEGRPYSETNAKELDKKLRNLPLVRLKSASQVYFYRGKVRVVLKVDDVITDRVDGIIGMAPNSANSEDNSLLLTGELNLELNNLFKSGKQLEVHWRNYLKNSQKLDLAVTYPYLFNTKLGINGEFNLNKFDTIFVNIKSKISFRYQQKGNNYFQFYYQNINSNLLSADTSSVRAQKTIPNNNPYKIDNYGVALYQRDYDYLPNPRKGYSVLVDFAVGQKTVIRNSEINQVKFLNDQTNKFISIYDTLKLRSTRLNFSLSTAFFIPIGKRSTIHQKIDLNALFAQQIFFNELNNFGGYSTLRGFDENELFASKALSYTLEYRYFIGENSNVGLFANAAAIENTIQSDKFIYDIPYGFGAIANIQVGKGILNLAYALGSQQGNPLQLSKAKFHFGVVNYF